MDASSIPKATNMTKHTKALAWIYLIALGMTRTESEYRQKETESTERPFGGCVPGEYKVWAGKGASPKLFVGDGDHLRER